MPFNMKLKYVISAFFIGLIILLIISKHNAPRYLRKVDLIFSANRIKDYSGDRSSSDSYFINSPNNTQEAIEIIRFAYDKNIPIRICGRNHSKNGFSLPKEKELLIKTENLDFLEFIDATTIKVGSGPSLNHLNDILNNFGLQLPVVNGADNGEAGPTVGGFISAGGLGNTSDVEGGFWENVLEITLVSGNGKIMHIKSGDPLFPWIFGSMGQLGLITEAVLKVVPRKGKKEAMIPIEKVLNLNKLPSKRTKNSFSKPLYWLNFFGTKEAIKKGRGPLELLRKEFQGYFEVHSFVGFERSIKYKEFNPPLIFNKKTPFIVLVLWGYLKPGFSHKDLAPLEKRALLVAEKFGFRRYVQTDYINNPNYFKLTWGEDFFRFYNLKKRLDPKFLFNRGLFQDAKNNPL